MVNLLWIWRDPTSLTSIQAIHASSLSNLLAVAGKNGLITLFKVECKEMKTSVELVHQWNVGSRPWSIWVQDSSWIAIGTNGVNPIVLYRLKKETNCRPEDEPIRLSAGTTKVTSVYALQSRSLANGVCQLLAGCYDGVLRLYHVDLALFSSRKQQQQQMKQPILPQRQMRDRFDPSAIYCLSLNVGFNSQQIAAGTARHGVCKFFQASDNQTSREEEEKQSWSIFAAHPSQSPTYSLVGQYNRLFGVTDAIFWQIDLRYNAADVSTTTTSFDLQDRQTLAFYRHGDMYLDRTQWPM